MKTKIAFGFVAIASIIIVNSCNEHSSNGSKKDLNLKATIAIKDSDTICLECPRSDSINAWYVGPYKGIENNIPLKNLAQDIYCADMFKNNNYSNGFVTIFGGTKITEENFNNDKKIELANNALYIDIMQFAKDWTNLYGEKYPIMTGGGPGLMEAGNRGAKKAGGPSISYSTYYDNPSDCDKSRPYKGDSSKVFWKYLKDKDSIITTQGLIFTSVAIREYAMIKHSAAIIIAPGGTGTEWEIFQIIETTKSKQLKKRPIYFIGNKELYWKSFEDLLWDMDKRGTLKYCDVKPYFEYVERPKDLIPMLKKAFNIEKK